MYGRTVLAFGLLATLVVFILLVLIWFKGNADSQPVLEQAGESEVSVTSQVAQRFPSIRGEVLSGFVSGRGTHWKVSWQLFRPPLV